MSFRAIQRIRVLLPSDGGAKLKRGKGFRAMGMRVEEGAKVPDTHFPRIRLDDTVDRVPGPGKRRPMVVRCRAITDSMTIPRESVGEATQTIQDTEYCLHTSILFGNDMDDVLSSKKGALSSPTQVYAIKG